jgi:dipeptidyl aminopeptidase/acylaminoacyl peptidase
MELDSSRQRRQKTFVWIVLGCIVLAAGYTSWVILRGNATAALIQEEPQGTPLPIAGPNELASIQNEPHLVFINEKEPYIGKVQVVGLDPGSPRRAQTDLLCGRVHYAAGNGLCLAYDSSSDFVWVTLFGADFQPRHQFTTPGIISRARVSPDGRYAAFTVFVSGHSYNDANMSTATILVDMTTGASLGNLEEFETWKDGQLYQALEFNFWGVTFAQDSNRFYATLRDGDTTYLVQGDIPARKLTVLHENVECPSLSPDGTRIAYKKLLPGMWQLTVLDLATMEETPLAEKESIDDQMEWLDNQRILYQKVDYDPPKWVSVFVLPADGGGKPEIFVPNATSPVVVR